MRLTYFQREIYYRERLRAYVCYTGRFVVGRGRECSDGCGLHSFEVCGLPSSLAPGVGALVCPGRGRASAPRLRVVPRVQVAHCPADLLYADTRRPSSGWRGPSATESVQASLRPPLRPTGDHCAYRVPYNRPASIFPLGPGAPVAALAVSVPLTVRGTPSPRFSEGAMKFFRFCFPLYATTMRRA